MYNEKKVLSEEIIRMKILMGLSNNNSNLMSEGLDPKSVEKLGKSFENILKRGESASAKSTEKIIADKITKSLENLQSIKNLRNAGEKIEVTVSKIVDLAVKDLSNNLNATNSTNIKNLTEIFKTVSENSKAFSSDFVKAFEKDFNKQAELFKSQNKTIDDLYNALEYNFGKNVKDEYQRIYEINSVSVPESKIEVTLSKDELDNIKLWGGDTLELTSTETKDLLDKVNQSTWNKIISNFTNTKYELDRIKKLTKSLSNATNSPQTIEILQQNIAESLVKVLKNSITDARQFIGWLEQISKKYPKDSRTIDKLLEVIKNNDLLKTYGSIIEKSKGKQVWEGFKSSFKNIFDYWKNSGEFSAHVINSTVGAFKNAWKSISNPVAYAEDLALREANKNVVDNLGFWRNYMSGSRKGFPKLSNKNYQELITKYGKTAAYTNYISTLGLKFIKWSAILAVLKTVFDWISWGLEKEKVYKCKADLKESVKKMISEGKKVELKTMSIPKSCERDGFIDAILLNAAMDFSRDSEGKEYGDVIKAVEELKENLFENFALSDLSDIVNVGWVDTSRFIYDMVQYSKDSTFDEFLKKMNIKIDEVEKEIETLKLEAEKANKGGIENVVNKTEETVNNLIDNSEVGFKSWIEDYNKQNPNNQFLYDSGPDEQKYFYVKEKNDPNIYHRYIYKNNTFQEEP